jgi:hypothetical protein
VVKRRLELSLEYLAAHTEDRLEYYLSSGARIVYPNTMLGEFLKGIYLELFEKKHNVSRILQGLSADIASCRALRQSRRRRPVITLPDKAPVLPLSGVFPAYKKGT